MNTTCITVKYYYCMCSNRTNYLAQSLYATQSSSAKVVSSELSASSQASSVPARGRCSFLVF